MSFLEWVFSKMFKKKDDTVSVKAVAGGGTALVLGTATFLALSQGVGQPMTQEFEGTVLKNYIDSVGVETWCVGETQMGRLEKGYTLEYCTALFNASYTGYSARLYDCYNDTAKAIVTPKIHAAFTDMYFNTGRRCNSGMMRHIKNGDAKKACDFILRYKFAGGEDCSLPSNRTCRGVWTRRLKMHELCIEGIPA